MTTAAVVILNYNGEKLLQEFLPSVIEHTPEANIIIADNGSTDNSIELLATHFPQVTILQLPFNYGFCKGYNESLKQITADIYILLNSDVAVSPGWLTPILKLFEHDPTIAAVQPKILSYRNKPMFEYAGGGGGYIDALGYPFCRGRIINTIEEDHGQYNDTRQVFWASGACMAIRSNVYHEFGGLDEDFFAHMEEIDLCWKIQRAHGKIFYCGESSVYHLGAGTLNYAHPRKTLLNFRNNMAMIFKHFSAMELLVKFPFRLILDWVASVVFLLQGKPAHAYAVLKAHAQFFGNIRGHLKKRAHIQKLYSRYSRHMVYKGSILFAYYVKKRRKFTDLE